MKLVKRFLQGTFYLIVAIFLVLIFSPTGPKAKEFCESYPVGSLIERSSVIHEMSNMKGGYIARVSHEGGELIFVGGTVTQIENNQSKGVSMAEALALQPHDVETFKVTSTGFSKRSCEVKVSASKVVDSKTWTWN